MDAEATAMEVRVRARVLLWRLEGLGFGILEEDWKAEILEEGFRWGLEEGETALGKWWAPRS